MLYPADLLDSFVLGVFCFVTESLRFSTKKTVSSINRNHLMSSFPVCMPFVPFFCLTAQARTSRTMLNKNQESRCPCLVPNPRGKAVGFLWCSLSCSGNPFHSYVYERFLLLFFLNHEWVLSFVKCLFGTDWYDQMIFCH